MRKFVTILIAMLVMSLPGPAFPWGYMTHNRGGDDLTAVLPDVIDLDVFIQANVGPDLAWTPIFSETNRSYIDTPEFAESLFQVASLNPQKYSNGLATAYGWGAHEAFDGVAHSSFVPEDQLFHTLVEGAVDTSIFYRGSPTGYKPLPRFQVNLDSRLISDASRLYREDYDPNAKLINPLMVDVGLAILNDLIDIEYGFILAQRGPVISEWFLRGLDFKDIIPGHWGDYYLASLGAAQDWIDLHPFTTHTPIPATLLLFGSSLLGLASYHRIWKRHK
jgi:hypothetical protein